MSVRKLKSRGIGRLELLAWLNEFLETDYTKVGRHACRLGCSLPVSYHLIELRLSIWRMGSPTARSLTRCTQASSVCSR